MGNPLEGAARAPDAVTRWARAAGITAGIAIAIATGILVWSGSQAPPPPARSCASCHDREDEAPPGVHASFGKACEICHLGNPAETDEDLAHEGMEREAGALQTVELTCGREGCHVRETDRVATSLMATGRGLISVDRWVFGEIETPDGTETLPELLAHPSPSPAQSHLRKLCAGCHLGTRRDDRDDAVFGGSGCGACHVDPMPTPTSPHPAIEATVPDTRCLGCHSRSARVSLSYQGLAETRAPPDAGCADPETLHDGRSACRTEADVHQVAGMGCVDCHLHTDLMGDGIGHRHEEEQVEITCEACHAPLDEDAEVRWSAIEDPITTALLMRQPRRPSDEEPVRVGRRGTPLWNLFREGPGWSLSSKAGSGSWAVPATPRDADHGLRGHERLTCTACHAAWAPMCPDCHTTFDPNGEQWEFGEARVTSGAWVETASHFSWGLPALAVRADGRIAPAIPGMILDVQPGPDAERIERRLFATLDPHTTRRESRPCRSCHGQSVALGLGEGRLEISPKGPRFVPARPDPQQPGRAADGWVTLFPEAPAAGTRTGLRSLDAVEQHRVLRVAPCLECHPETDDPIYADFDTALRRNRAGRTTCLRSVDQWMLP